MSLKPETTASIHHDGSGDWEDTNCDYICPSLSLSCLGGVGPPGCRFKYHHRTPYHWQLILQVRPPLLSPPSAATARVTPTTIVDIDDDQTSKEIEKQFSNPDTTQTIVQFNNRLLTIDFDTMNVTSSEPAPRTPDHGEGSRVLNSILGSFFTTPASATTPPPGHLITIKRLSTPPNIILQKQPNTTEWMWYWQSDDETVNWSEMVYKETTSDDQISPFGTLERLYQQSIMNPSKPMVKKFTLTGKREIFRISINFNKLTMRMDGEDYPLRRRPATFNTFVDWCYLQQPKTVTGVTIPSRFGISSGAPSRFTSTTTTPLSWVTFGDLSPEGDTRYPITAQELESHYIAQGDRTFTHSAYTIDLDKKVLTWSPRREGANSVRIRRDTFKPNQLIALQNYPATWDPMPLARIFVTITVPEFTSEFKKVQDLFSATQLNLTRLRRIQNPASYNSFMQNKALLKKKFPNISVREETLFHGTKDFNIKLICEMNFDPMAPTVNGSAYGKGSYFAKTPAYSINYGQYNVQNIVKLFVCRVLVGPTEQGIPADPMITMVDNKTSPYIFVNRLNHSFYPEYIAELSDPKGRGQY